MVVLDQHNHQLTLILLEIDQAKTFLKGLGRRLAGKRQRSYSQVMGFVRSRMTVAILQVSSQCLALLTWTKVKNSGHSMQSADSVPWRIVLL
jgi:hypothetical protein